MCSSKIPSKQTVIIEFSFVFIVSTSIKIFFTIRTCITTFMKRLDEKKKKFDRRSILIRFIYFSCGFHFFSWINCFWTSWTLISSRYKFETCRSIRYTIRWWSMNDRSCRYATNECYTVHGWSSWTRWIVSWWSTWHAYFRIRQTFRLNEFFIWCLMTQFTRRQARIRTDRWCFETSGACWSDTTAN